LTPRRLSVLIAPMLLALAMGVLVGTLGIILQSFGGQLALPTQKIVHDIVETIFWLAIAWVVSRLLDVFLWSSIEHRTGRPAPQLLVAVGRLVVLALAIAVIITVIFEHVLTGLVVSSGVVGIVLGFALQRMISDFFSGIAMGMEHPFRVGDWIEVDGVTGKVIETNWRATRMITLEHVMVVLPNSFIAERRFHNHNLPEPWFRTETKVTLEFEVPPHDAKRVLIAAVRSTPGVLGWPQPDVLLAEFATNGHEFTARYFVSDYAAMRTTRDAVNTSIAHHLWQAGFAIAYPKTDLFHARMPHRDLDRKTDRSALLARVELFESLSSAELQVLASSLIEKKCSAGEDIVKQGDPGASLFVVVDGLLEVKVEHEGQVKVVGRIAPGEFFGEISLLTGSPRGACVTAITDATLYELTHEVISPILQQRPEIAKEISRYVAIRRTRNSKAMEKADAVQRAREEHSFTEDLLRKIRGFFGLEL